MSQSSTASEDAPCASMALPRSATATSASTATTTTTTTTTASVGIEALAVARQLASSLGQKTNKVLQDMCVERRLSRGGTKAALVMRLVGVEHPGVALTAEEVQVAEKKMGKAVVL